MTDFPGDTIEELFEHAMDLPEAEREPWLRERCGEDKQLYRDLLSLLDAHERANNFLDRPALEQSQDFAPSFDPLIGSIVGQYRVIERVGTGGMGSVYLAERIDESFDRRVAVKLIRRGLVSGDLIERFDRERRVLANLNHPNIAALIDAGSLADGSPYFVMEYVSGKRIDQYCDDRKLTIPKRIELFRTVCEAVSHAHRNLVIHRDLKPANIMVTEDGTVKLLDFGVAKVLAASDSEPRYDHTLTVERRLTPAYASPEQVRGRQVTTSSDVYSLGVILYELLTGFRPYRLESESWRDIEQAICDAQPTRPSQAVSSPTATTSEQSVELSRNRGVDPSRLSHLLKGDIEWVLLMALRKEPQRRYSTVEQLSEDLRRIGASLPVLARPDTLSYRASRFVRRNRTAVAWAALLAISLIFASVISVNLAIRESLARESEQEQRQVAEAERDRAIAAETTAQQRADELEQVAAFQANQLEGIDIEQMGRRILEQILTSARLDASLSGASEDRARQIETDIQNALTPINFANVARDAIDEAVFDPSLRSIDEAFEKQPLIKARLLESVAKAMASVGMLRESIEAMQQVVQLRREYAGDRDPVTLDALLQLGNHRIKMGDASGAEADLLEALNGFEAVLGPDSQRAISTRSALGAAAQAMGDIARAESYYKTALKIARQHLGDQHETTLSIINNLAFLTLDAGQLDQAEPYFLESLETTRLLFGDSDISTLRRIYALGLFRARQGRNDEAYELVSRSYEGLRTALGDAHPDTVIAMIELARVLFNLRRNAEASAYADAAYELSLGLADNHRHIQQSLNVRGRLAMASGDFESAEAIVREEIERHISQYGPTHPRVSTAQGNLALIIFRSGKVDEAEQLLREAYDAQIVARGESHPMTLSLLNNLGGVVRAQGKLDEAKRYWTRVYEGRKSELGPNHPHTLQTLQQLISLAQQENDPLHRYNLLCELVNSQALKEGVEPAQTPSAVQLAIAAQLAGEHDHALDLAVQFRELNVPFTVPEVNATRFMEGDALLALSRFEEAEEAYLMLDRRLRDDSRTTPVQTMQLHERISRLYRAWFESSDDPDHLARAEHWEQRSADTEPAAQQP